MLVEEDRPLLENDKNSHDAESFVTIAAQKLTELETVKKSVADGQKSSPRNIVPWPPRADAPINEFVTEGYISCVFPTLFGPCLTKTLRWKIAKLRMRTGMEEQFYTTLFHFIIT